jgi:hypothetical protein
MKPTTAFALALLLSPSAAIAADDAECLGFSKFDYECGIVNSAMGCSTMKSAVRKKRLDCTPEIRQQAKALIQKIYETRAGILSIKGADEHATYTNMKEWKDTLTGVAAEYASFKGTIATAKYDREFARTAFPGELESAFVSDINKTLNPKAEEIVGKHVEAAYKNMVMEFVLAYPRPGPFETAANQVTIPIQHALRAPIKGDDFDKAVEKFLSGGRGNLVMPSVK